MIHEIKNLYSEERITPPFLIRKYSNKNVDLNALYRIKHNSNEFESGLKFDEYAENYYRNHDRERKVKIFRSGLFSESLSSYGSQMSPSAGASSTGNMPGGHSHSQFGSSSPTASNSAMPKWHIITNESDLSMNIARNHHNRSPHSTKSSNSGMSIVLDKENEKNINDAIEKLVIREINKARLNGFKVNESTKSLDRHGSELGSAGSSAGGRKSPSGDEKSFIQKLKFKFRGKINERKAREQQFA